MKNTFRAKFGDMQILNLFYFFMMALHDFSNGWRKKLSSLLCLLLDESLAKT